MAHLLRLAASARTLLTRELAEGTLARVPEANWHEHATELERSIDIEAFDRTLEDLLTTTDRHSSAIDRLAAAPIHRALPLTRREAADPGIWRWLTVARWPEFVRHRWEFQSWPTMRDRFWRAGMRHDSNIFCRLWWIAELTRDGDDYSLTERALRIQSIAIGVFIRRFAHFPAAVRACVNVLDDELSQQVVEACLKRFNARLALFPLEARSEVELEAELVELIDLAWDEQAQR